MIHNLRTDMYVACNSVCSYFMYDLFWRKQK